MAKKIPAASVVVRVPRAPGLVAAEGKLQLMERVRQLSDNGEKIMSALMRILVTSESEKMIIEAADRLLAYGWGKPIETKVTADVSSPPSGGHGLSILTSEQLEAVATKVLAPEKDVADTEEDAEIDSGESEASPVDHQGE